MSQRSLRSTAAGLLGLALTLAACPSGDPTPSASATRTIPEATPSVTPTPTASPVRGGTLAIATTDLGTLDPAKAATRAELLALTQLFEPLTRIDRTTNTVQPGAARSWRVSKDGLRWVFTLRKATFRDGTRVRSRDFKFAFDRLTRRETGSDAAFQLEQVEGFAETKVEGSTDELAGVIAKKSRELVIRLQRPFAELPYYLAHPALGPLPRDRYEDSRKGLGRNPIGNGPFRPRDFSDERVLLEPNARWRGDEPWLDAIVFRIVRTIDAGWRAFRDGEVHVAEIPPSAVQAGGIEYGEGGLTPFWATLSFGFNTERKVFRKAAVRRAVSLAVDRGAIASSIYGDTRDPATGLLPAGIRGYGPDACQVCDLDRQRARQIIEAAFRGKPRIGLHYLNESSSRQVAKAIRSDLERVGFKVDLKPHKRGAYLDVLEEGRFDLAQLGWLSAVPSPDDFLNQQLRTDQLNNHTGWSDADFDKRLDRARKENDEDKRLNHYRKAESIALDAMPLMPVVFFRNRSAVALTVQDLSFDGAGLFDASEVWLAP